MNHLCMTKSSKSSVVLDNMQVVVNSLISVSLVQVSLEGINMKVLYIWSTTSLI